MIDWTPMIQECAPQVAPSTMQAVIRTESGFNPLAININGKAKLARRPNSEKEAANWAQWLVARGYSIDMGLMQINSANLRRLGLNTQTVFDPCNNLRAGARILVENYRKARQKTNNPQAALLQAISAYNTGNFERGFRNGYVARVIGSHENLSRAKSRTDGDAPPLLVAESTPSKKAVKKRKNGTD